jgi:hypothetical protein
MYSSGDPAGTENSVASCVLAVASGTKSCSQTTPAVSTSGAAAEDQKGGLERNARQLNMASSLAVFGPRADPIDTFITDEK